MGIVTKGSIGKLCNQRCGKRRNDINYLALYNKRAKLTYGKGTFGKNPHNITSYHFQSRIAS